MLSDSTDIERGRTIAPSIVEELERLRFASDATLDGIWDWNIVTGDVHFSPQWERLLGHEPGTAPQRVEHFFTVLHPDDVEAIRVALEDHLAGRTPVKQQEVRLLTKSGEYRWFLDRGKVVVRADDGRPLRMVGTITDIHERKRVESALQASERELRLIVGNVPGPVARVDGNCRYLFVNEQYLPTFGLTWEMTVGKTIAEVIGPAAWRQVEPYARRALAGERVQYERVYVDPVGNERPVLVHFVPDLDEERRVVGFFIMTVDITERKRAEAALKATSDLLEEAQAVARTGNWSIDLISGRASWSKQLFKLHGFHPTNGAPSPDAVHARYVPEDAQRLREAMQLTATDGRSFSVTARVREPVHGARWLRCEGRARRDEIGTVVGIFGTTTDVTAEIEREEALRVARNQADAASKAKSEFLANMSHEMRTPLTVILGFTDLLRGDSPLLLDPVRRAQTIETIRNAGRHLLTVINDILDLSKIEANRMTIERIETPLVAILAEVEQLVRASVIGKDLAVTTLLASPLPERIHSDPTRLRQVLLNLAGNAAKFTARGHVTIVARAAMVGGRRRLLVDVEDSGPGIRPEQAQALFEPFGQIDTTVTRTHGGSGLGLAITRRLADLMGGDVSLVRTVVGQGSCFRLDLPLDAVAGTAMLTSLDALPSATAEQRDASPPSESIALAGRVLLVEDVVDNQRLIAFHLERAGATVEVAANGRVAIELLERFERAGRPFDLMLTDMHMPEMDGYTLATTLRERGSTLPIIALTARAMAEDAAGCLAAGCDDFATKPIDTAALLMTCRRWLGAASERSATPRRS